MTTTQPAPRSFFIVSGLFLVWNLLGVMAFFFQIGMTKDALAAMPEAQRLLYETMPGWVNIAFAVAVFGGTAGCVLLLMKKSLALPVFVASLLGVLAQSFHSFFMSNAIEVMGSGSVAMPVLVMAGCVFLIYYSLKAKSNGWIA